MTALRDGRVIPYQLLSRITPYSLGPRGTSSSDIATLAQRSVSDNLLGIMVWYASVKNGFQYKQSQQWDASISEEAIQGFKAAMATFRQGGAVPRRIY